jgi:hypothetical protein
VTFVLALAGSPASGKTTVSRIVASAAGARHVGFGDLVRARVREQGLPDHRTAWQQVGSQLRAELGPGGLVSAALTHAGLDQHDVPVVWDGVRHVDVVAALQTLYRPRRVVLVALRPPEPARRARFLVEARTEAQLKSWEQHESERHLVELFAIADIVCCHDSAEDAATAVLAYLGQQRTDNGAGLRGPQ